jgi:hypothetical protein
MYSPPLGDFLLAGFAPSHWSVLFYFIFIVSLIQMYYIRINLISEFYLSDILL